jgi:hypothetical protein
LILGVSYGLIEEGFASQSLFNPTLYHAADWGARFFGVNGSFAVGVLGVHAVWSAAIPILVVSLLYPGKRRTPFLRKRGLVVTAIVYCIGVALLWLIARYSFGASYNPPAVLPIAALGVALVLGLIALRFTRREGVTPKLEDRTPSPWFVLAFVAVVGFLFQACSYLWALVPALSKWPASAAPLVASLIIGAGLLWMIARWSRTSRWDDRHRLAIAVGAITCHVAVGILAIATTVSDKIWLAVLATAVLALLAAYAVRVGRRVRGEENIGVTPARP